MLSLLVSTILADVSSSENTPFTSDDFVTKLFPNFWSFIINLLALVVLFVALYFIAYKPVKKIVKARRDHVEHNLHDAEQAKAIAQRNIAESEKAVSEAKKQASLIVGEAQKAAIVGAAAIKAQAETEAEERQRQADIAIRQAEEKSQKEVREQIVNVALDASKKVLEREINEKDDAALVDSFVAGVDKTGEGK